MFNLIIKELEDIKAKFSVKRRTKIIDAVLNYNIEETIQKESVVINISNKGYIKRYLELPKNKIIRAYLVKVWGRELTKKNLEDIRSGIEISQFQYAPMEINLISKKRNIWLDF